MGRITDALKKVTDGKLSTIQQKPKFQYVIKKVENTNINQHIVSFHDPSSPAGEQYKILRTNIQALRYSKNYKTFVISSAINGEGKTVTSINLAIAMAHDVNAKSILLIDADMRRGGVSRYLGIDKTPGLSAVLKGEIREDEALVDPGIENLTVMLSGSTPRNPSELLSSKRMEQLISGMKARFDYVFIDTPPVMPLTDPCILAPMADGVILALQAGRTQRDTVNHMEHRLLQAHANILGYVLTNIEYHVPSYLYKYINEYANYASYNNNTKEEINEKEEVMVK